MIDCICTAGIQLFVLVNALIGSGVKHTCYCTHTFLYSFFLLITVIDTNTKPTINIITKNNLQNYAICIK